MVKMICFGIGVMVCEPMNQPTVTAGATFCQAYSPVRWSPNDTRKSKEQNDLNNRKWKALCRKR